ncbi:MAG: hypothetical protein H6772_02445 [Pseudomonadales bacterium]|nr:hypothetical protein [Pseudomonadales bacterium]
MEPLSYSSLYKLSYLVVLVPTFLIIVTALMSAKQLGGTLGSGLKKISGGTVIHTIVIVTFYILETGFRGMLDDTQIRLFFMFSSIIGAILLISGYFQIYKVAKKLKLFTV